MDDLKQELNELKGFIADLKADKAAAKGKEKREAWTKYVSLTIVVIAALAAVAAQWSGKLGGRAQTNLAQESDAWNAFQAESIKEKIYDSTRKQFAKNATDPDTLRQQKEFDDKVADYEKKKADWQSKAEDFEKTRADATKRNGFLATAISFYSISIAVASTCLLTKKKPLWLLAMALAAGGLVEMILSKVV